MILDIFLKPNSKFPKVEYLDGLYVIHTRSKPHKGAANKEMIQLLSDHLDVSKSSIEIIKGFKSKKKKVKIEHGTDI